MARTIEGSDVPLVTQSMLKAARDCWRKYHYRYEEQIGKKAPPLPLIRGTILHEMIDARALGNVDPMEVLRKYEKAYKKLFNAEKEIYGDIIGECDRIFKAYSRHYADEEYTYERSEEPAFTDLTNEIRYAGTIDKIAVDKHGRRWIMDHKSHKHFPDEGQRMSDIQLVLYVWAWNRWNPEHKVSGIIWDYIKTKPPGIPELVDNGKRLSKRQIETDYTTYMRTIKEHKLNPKDYQEVLSKLESQESPFFKRIPLPNPPAALIESVVRDAQDTATLIVKLGKVLKTRNLSRNCGWCEFNALCQADIRGLDVSFVRKDKYEHKEPREYYNRVEED